MNPRRRPQARPFFIACALILFALPIAHRASAQTGPDGWNRRVEAVTIVEDPTTGLYDVHAVIGVHLNGTSTATTTEDLSITVELNPFAGGDPHYGWIELTVEYDPASAPPGGGCIDGSFCGGSCGTGYVDGVLNNLLCLPDGPCSPLCDCVCKFPSITVTFPGRNLQPGDEIMVLLRPSPGAVPDPDSSDDQMGYTFESEVLWDRRVDSISLTEVGTGVYDVDVDGTNFHEGLLNILPAGAAANMDSFFDVFIDGALHSSVPVDFRPVPLAAICSCASACATWDGNTHSCMPFIPSSPDCYCGWPWRKTIPGMTLVPEDVITVILRPVPGALPELPGFEEDDIDSLACCSTPTGVEVFSATVEELLSQNSPNPFSRSTEIAFSVESRSSVELAVYDLHGRRLQTLIDGDLHDPGRQYRTTWDGRTAGGDRAPSGVYFARLSADGRHETRKMTLLD